jgi:hypothetical protein
MFRKLTACVLALLLAAPAIQASPVISSVKSEKEERLAQRVKAGISKLGVGPEARVQVKLKDKTKLAGYVSEAGAEHFVVMNTGTGHATTIAYPAVAQVQGNNLSTKVKIIITASVIAGIIIVLYIVKGAFCDGC